MAAEATQLAEGSPKRGALRGLSRFSWRRPALVRAGQISIPLALFVFVYVAALVALLVQGVWTTDAFTGKVIHSWTLDNFHGLLERPYPQIIARTVGIAAAVTVACMLIAFPYAYFLARIASRRLRVALLVATVLPLWVSYLVRVYSWRLILNEDGALNWTLDRLRLPTLSIAYTNWAMWLVFTYIWLPFMVLPVYAALERIPSSFLDASADLGARGSTTLRRVILPLAVPGLAAGSIFTFSLTLGDYIAPALVGGPGSQLIGNVVYDNIGLANNAPFAAALAAVPLLIMGVYLTIMKRLGAFESL